MNYTEYNLPVWLLNFGPLNTKITGEILHTLPEPERNKVFYYAAQYHGLVEINNRVFLVDRQCNIITPHIDNLAQPELLFELDVFEELPDALKISSKYKGKVRFTEISLQETLNSICLKAFMENNYKSSPEIHKKMLALLKYVNSGNEKTQYPLV